MKVSDIFETKLNEDSNDFFNEVKELSKILRNNCREIYENFYKSDVSEKFRHSASRLPEDDIYFVAKNKEDRKPTDTPEYFHKIMDDALNTELGERFRSNALFTYYKNFSSSSYVVFPFDGYKIATSPYVNDMYILVKDFLTSGAIEKMYVDFIEDYVELEDDSAKIRADIIPNHVFNLLPKGSWMKQSDFPDLDKFIGVFETHTRNMLGNDAVFKASKEDYSKLLKRTLEMTENHIRNQAKKYKLVHQPGDIEIVYPKYNELMIHSEKFVLVNTAELLRHLVDKDYDYKETEVIAMLYKNDLTAFE